MRWFKKEQQFETVLQRLVAAVSGSVTSVNPESCLKSPTVTALVTAISRRISITPIHIYQTSMKDGREIKEKLPNHSVAKLLKAPNEYQSYVDYLGDMASCLVRYNRFIAVKGQGATGPIRRLDPITPSEVDIKRDPDTFEVTFRKKAQEWPMKKIHYIRGPARDFIQGDSTVENIKTAIGLEIACEEYGATFFGNGAVPLMIFKYMQGSKGFKTPEDEKKFVNDFQDSFKGNKRHKAMLMPVGMELNTPNIENDKAQFLETRKFYQTVIAGAWGVPPHLVGNLENGHYNNVEQQDKDFTLNVIMPYVKSIEASMERDLLTEQDRNSGIVIRFNMDAVLRASFDERQSGLQTQFQNGVISQDEWREIEGKNPKSDGKGTDYYYSANLIKEGEEPLSRQNELINEDPDED